MICKAYLALGSNVGARERNLSDAINLLAEIPGIKVINVSKVYETEPVGYLNQGNFLNMVILITTDKKPLELLAQLQKIEIELKRSREIHWGPRTIDIDILLFDELEINLPELIIPHPRMFERAFVLIPLKDVFEYELIKGKKLDVLINTCADRNGIRFFDDLRR
jgi:2-amino-4-hydroxy-6-hydroxymethyldihydropteridine diphosphokinase